MSLDFRKSVSVLVCVPRLCPFVVLLKAALKIKMQVLSEMCEVLTEVFVKIQVFWEVNAPSIRKHHRRFEGQ